jgi:hypothetical protein
MSYPGPGPIQRHYRNCLMCGNSFSVRRCEMHQPNLAKFCSRECYFASRLAFSAALGDGRLESLLAPEREAARRKRATRKMDDFLARKLAS